MNSYIAVPGIRFNDSVFSEPKRLVDGTLPKCGGIFAILGRDPNWAPKPFQPLYFQEFGNNSPNTVLSWHPIRWSRGADIDALYVSVLPMPFSSAAQRCEVFNHLIWAYNPVCQGSDAPAVRNDLARRFDELEKKHEEQTMHIRLLLAGVNRLFEPQAEPRRRPIGFVPQPAAAS
jgi:hypothetical protein